MRTRFNLLFWCHRRRLTRAPNRGARAFFSAAGGGRLLSDWAARDTSIDRDIYGSIRRLRARSRELEQNNPVMAKYLGLVETNLVGAQGFTLQVRGKLADGTSATRQNHAIEQAFKDWGDTADLSGRTTRSPPSSSKQPGALQEMVRRCCACMRPLWVCASRH